MPTQLLLLRAWFDATRESLAARLRAARKDGDDAGFTVLEYAIAGAIAAVAVAAIATLIYNHFHDKATDITRQ
jgi:hypothetical protein